MTGLDGGGCLDAAPGGAAAGQPAVAGASRSPAQLLLSRGPVCRGTLCQRDVSVDQSEYVFAQTASSSRNLEARLHKFQTLLRSLLLVYVVSTRNEGPVQIHVYYI